ncbi:MAG: aldo/keto reductase [Rhodospirillaceae bacterium]|jgi:aryl-alcohol dehydrogenase-like predicted oxidoreductase|nr:aldo/keto reductase [Rhodospirillaceae bacterium]
MKMNPLGRTGISVSQICLGTMTFGSRNTEAEAHAQMDLAFERGINFIDTAEMYPFPVTTGSCGRTEEVVGSWMRARANRDEVVVGTKAVGPGVTGHDIRGGNPKFDRDNLMQAVDGSLRRLGTDYIDLYQTHWPARPTNFFGKLDYKHDPDAEWTPFAETLSAMDEIVKAGKVRAFGVSNETPWGVAAQLKLADDHHWPRIASIQNPYSLLNRTFEIGLAEIAIREDCGLLAYSPLGFGALSGKYLDGVIEPGSRRDLFPHLVRYFHEQAEHRTREYVTLARSHGLDPAEMALAYTLAQPFQTSTIIGATNLQQLASNLNSSELVLTTGVVQRIEEIHAAHPNPCP